METAGNSAMKALATTATGGQITEPVNITWTVY